MHKTNSTWRALGLVGAGAVLFATLACDKSTGSSVATANPTSPQLAEPANPDQNAEAAMPRLTAAESIKLVKEGKAIVIDVRGTESYKASHAKGSIDFPLNKLEAGDFVGLPRDKRIIAYCT
ncbi:MAG: rhodanese-like domain-containing protein [Acidobacteria bacterium]|nr:rhodanese-like domain-containing protein [Acidobacteriota bacterium]